MQFPTTLHGEKKTLEMGNALLNSSSVQSKIVSFSVSSSLHPEQIAIDNAFVVPNLNVRYHKIDINKIRSSFPSFKDIELQKLNKTEAKKSVECIGRNGIFYATPLKCFKREFGNPNVVTHLKLKLLFDQPQIKAVDRASLKLYHQKLKSTNTWLVSI